MHLITGLITLLRAGRGRFAVVMQATPDAGGQAMTMQVWEAETGSDLLVLREVLGLAESDPELAATVMCALYSLRDDPALDRILTAAEEAPMLCND
jgi:hypothetical protein